MSAAQKKVIDDHCTDEWSGKVASPWADFEHDGVKKLKADRRTRSTRSRTRSSPMEEGAEPLEKTWADNVKKAGGDPAAIMKDLKESLAKYSAAY